MATKSFSLAVALAFGAASFQGSSPNRTAQFSHICRGFTADVGIGKFRLGFVGTGIDLGCYTEHLQWRINGGSWTTLATPGWFNNGISITGLADNTPHLLEVERIAGSYGFIMSGETSGDTFCTITGAAPALSSVSRYTYYPEDPTIQREIGLLEWGAPTVSANAETRSYPMALRVGGFRFRSAATSIIVTAKIPATSTISLFKDNDNAAITETVGTGTSAWALYTFSGLDGTAHDYELFLSTGSSILEIQTVGAPATRASTQREVLVEFGDSLTEGTNSGACTTAVSWATRLRAEPYCVLNYGVASTTLKGREWEVDVLTRCKPKAITLAFGANESASPGGANDTSSTFGARVESVSRGLLGSLPSDGKLIVQGITPRSGSYTANITAFAAAAQASVTTINDSRCTFLDVTTLGLDATNDFPDGLHLDANGNEKMRVGYAAALPGGTIGATSGGSGTGEPSVTTTETMTLTTTPQAIATSDCKLQIRLGRNCRIATTTESLTVAPDDDGDYMELDSYATLQLPVPFNVGSGATLYAWKTESQSSEVVKLTVMS